MSGIVRTRHDESNHFAQISRKALQNSALSWEARGVLAYLLSKPGDWETQFTDLVRQGPGEADRMRRILKELETAGHVVRTRRNGADGRWQWETTVYENPADAMRDMTPYADFPYMADPHMEKPDTVSPDMENRHIYKDKKSTKKESTNTDTTNTRETAPAPAARDIAPTGRKLTPGVNAPKPLRKQTLPNPYPLTEEMRVWARQEEPDLGERLDREHKKFCATYWANGELRANWRPMWELWMHRAVTDFAPRTQQKGSVTYERTYEDPDAIAAEIAALAAADRATHQDVPGDGAQPVPFRRRA